jgi:hypothetical protein
MDRPALQGSLSARALAEILNEADVSPEIMGMATYVALKADRWMLTWTPRNGWMSQGRDRPKAA